MQNSTKTTTTTNNRNKTKLLSIISLAYNKYRAFLLKHNKFLLLSQIVQTNEIDYTKWIPHLKAIQRRHINHQFNTLYYKSNKNAIDMLHKQIQENLKILKLRIIEHTNYIATQYKNIINSKIDIHYLEQYSDFSNKQFITQEARKSLSNVYMTQNYLKNVIGSKIKLKTLKHYDIINNFNFNKYSDLYAKIEPYLLFNQQQQQQQQPQVITHYKLWYNKIHNMIQTRNYKSLMESISMIADVLLTDFYNNPNAFEKFEDYSVKYYTIKFLVMRFFSTLIINVSNTFLNVNNLYAFKLVDRISYENLDKMKQNVSFQQFYYLRHLLKSGQSLKKFFIYLPDSE